MYVALIPTACSLDSCYSVTTATAVGYLTIKLLFKSIVLVVNVMGKPKSRVEPVFTKGMICTLSRLMARPSLNANQPN